MTRKRITIGFLAIGTAALVAVLWPLPAEFAMETAVSTRITDRTGRLLYDLRGKGLSEPVPLSAVTDDFIDALIATEDRTFFSHPGLSLRGIVRAAWRDLLAGAIVEGGSTITQQYVRAVLEPRSRGVAYKIREAWLALKVDALYTKDDILERYINSVFFGQQSYGIGAAARTYFDKSPGDLSLAESAMLAGLVNAPSSLNPFKNSAATLKRRDTVLRSMVETGRLTQAEFEEALQEPLQLSHGRVPIRAPHFVFWLVAKHPELTAKGGEVRTTLDLDLQSEVERIVQRQIERLSEKNVTSAAVVVLDALHGDIFAMVGSADYFDDENDGAVNVAVSARQPGSAIKPFTYALALRGGMTPASTVSDTEARFFTQDGNPYTPRNYDYLEHGLVRLREALANSYNIAAVRVLEKVGVERLLLFLKQAGISTLSESPEHYGLALTLGDSEVRLLELTAAFAIFPRGGRTLTPRALSSQAEKSEQILDAETAWLITDILSDDEARLAQFGADSPLSFDFPVAAKTGTTRNSRDNWTVGFTPRHIVGVWVGNADNTPMKGTTGVTGAGPIFHDVILAAEQGLPPQPFERPAAIIEREICKLSGKLPTDLCPDRLYEFFASNRAPQERDDIYVLLPIDTRNGLLAGEGCASQFVREELFTRFPADTEQWARANGWKVPPKQYSPLCSSSGSFQHPIVITRPGVNAEFLLDPLVPDHSEKILFEAVAQTGIDSVDWYVDGIRQGRGVSPDFRYAWVPVAGSHVVQAGTGAQAARVRITVRK